MLGDERPSEHHPPLDAIGARLEPDRAYLGRIARAPEGEIRITEVDEGRRPRIPPNQIDQFLNFLSRGPAIGIDHQPAQGKPKSHQAANRWGLAFRGLAIVHCPRWATALARCSGSRRSGSPTDPGWAPSSMAVRRACRS